MLGWLFGSKKEAEEIKEETRKAFDAVRKDIDHVGKWIKHLHGKDAEHHELISSADSRLSSVETELQILREQIEQMQAAGLFKQTPTAVYKHTAVQGVLDAVQTPVQTGVEATFLFGNTISPLENLTSMERAIVYLLLQSDMRLSYEDLAVMLGKDRSTLRGQINLIKKKCEGLIMEHIESNGKKRVYIPDEIKQKLVKNAKMRNIKRTTKGKKTRSEGENDG